MKTTTIRKLLTVAVTQALQQKHHLKSEIYELVDYIMNSSLTIVTPDDNIDLREGNFFAIGE